jgi:hypothetical protein
LLSRADIIGMVLEEQAKDRLDLSLVARVEEKASRTHARGLEITFEPDLVMAEKARLIGSIKHEDPGVVFDHL